jgi:hypothetical protein
MTAFPFLPRFATIGLLAAMAITLAGCDSQPSAAAFPYIRMAPDAPPAPMAETVPVIDQPQVELWRPGYWQYDPDDINADDNNGFIWMSGGMMERPAPTAVWSPDQWQHRAYGWVFVPGYWQ